MADDPQHKESQTADPSQIWQASYEALLDGWQQAQNFWTSAAQNWGRMAGKGLGQTGISDDITTVLRELQEATFAVSQAWMRLPLLLSNGAKPEELQEAFTRLTQAQGRAYQLWTEAMRTMGGIGEMDGGPQTAEASASGETTPEDT